MKYKIFDKYIIIIKIFILCVIFFVNLNGCSNETTPGPPNVGPSSYDQYVSLQMTPTWLGTASSSITFKWFSKHSASGTGTISGYLNIKDISMNMIIHQESITIYNDEAPRTLQLSASTMGLSIDKIYEAYITYNNPGEINSQHLTFLYGDVNNNCFGVTRHSINIEYDYMGTNSTYDLLSISNGFVTNSFYTSLAVNTYSDCRTDINTNFNTTAHAYDDLNCNSTVVDMLNTLKNYCTNNRDLSSNQYIVSANKLTNPPPVNLPTQPIDYATLWGLTPLNSSIFPNYRPCFIFFGYISGYGTTDKYKFGAWTFAHELGHTRGISDNDLHYQTTSDPVCCIMLPSYPLSSNDCPTNYIKAFCKYHRCSVYNNSYPSNKGNNTNSVNEIIKLNK